MPLVRAMLAGVQHRKAAVAAWLALSVVATSLVVLAVTSDGFPAHKAELNDGGVWVTRQDSGAVARQNVPIAQLDTRVWADKPGQAVSALDVFQNGSAVISYGPEGTLMPIDVVAGDGVRDQQAAIAGSPAMGGSTISVVDPDKGRVWVSTVKPSEPMATLSGLSSETKPVGTVGPDALGAVSVSGTAVAVSADKGNVLTIHNTEGRLSKPEKSKLEENPSGNISQLSMAGEKLAFLDEKGGLGFGGNLVQMGDSAQLQQAGPDSARILVATAESLEAVAAKGGARTTLVKNPNPAEDQVGRPVRLGSCDWQVWWTAGTAHAVTACDGAEPQVAEIPGVSDAPAFVWRTNRNQIVLNDTMSGDVWKVEGEAADKISDWDAFEKQEDEQQQTDPNPNQQAKETPPIANPDKIGVRPGRTSVLHVLDNDQASTSAILAVVDPVERGSLPDGVDVQIAPDRQSLLAITQPAAPLGTYNFNYTVDDGSGSEKSTAKGKVTLTVGDQGSGKPELRPNYATPKLSVVAGRSLEFPVVQDWRDPAFSDPIAVSEVKASAGTASVTTQGLIKFVAPDVKEQRPIKVTYSTSTGGEKSSDSVNIVVVPATAKAVPPTVGPDAVAGQVGGAIVVKPLENDLPGADPRHPDAQLEIGGDVSPVEGQRVETDRQAGTVTIHPSKPGSFLFSYSAAFGDAARAVGQIRVDVSAATNDRQVPVAGPDTATVRGQAATTVDVLANDFDPKGGLLAVTQAEAVAEDPGVQVAIIDGRWLRVSAVDPQLETPVQAIKYTVSNGSAEAEGSLTVTQEAPLAAEENAPIPEDDKVTVRSGSVIEIPVLDNDTTPSGDPVGLLPMPKNDEQKLAVGEYPVLSPDPARESGRALMSGRRVRYLAPPDDGNGPRDVRIQYTVVNTGDDTAPAATGTVYVHVTPKPDKFNPNQDPTPRAIEGRVVQGDTITLRLPTVGVDPDGDPVTVVGVGDSESGGSPRLGRVLSISGTTIEYQAFPGMVGTDRFRYTVEDPYGKRAVGSIGVAVTEPGAPQPPTAIDDLIKADTNRELEIDPLVNDLSSPGAKLNVEPLEDAPDGVVLDEATGLLTLKTSGDNNAVTEIPYRATNGLDASKAVVRVRTEKGFDNPPVADDIYASPQGGDDTVTVDVFKHVYDIDDKTSSLTLSPVTGAKSLGEGRLEIKVTGEAQVLPFEVTDPAGAVAVAAIRVPPVAKDTPFLKPDALVKVGVGKQVTVALDDLVGDPEGDKVYFTTLDPDAFFAAPQDRFKVKAAGTDLEVTGGDKAGMGAVTFTVSDREKLADPEAHVATLTVPVQVGDPKPAITCPTAPLKVAEGGRDLSVDVPSVCHVWTPDPAHVSDLKFEGKWKQPVPGVDLQNKSGRIFLKTGSGSKAGDRGQIDVGVVGEEPSAVLNVLVTKLPPPRLAAVNLEGHGGQPVKIDMKDYLQTQVSPEALDVQVIKVEAIGSPTAPASSSGSVVTVNPGKDTFGTLKYRVEVSDSGKTSARPRAVGVVKVSVATRPSAPQGLSASQDLMSNSAALSWGAAKPNGAPITKYVVKYSSSKKSGEYPCGGSPCKVTGLPNGVPYTFMVKAVNAEGESDWSNSASATPDKKAGPVVNLRVLKQQDHRVTLSWSPPAKEDASEAKSYQISYPGGLKNVAATQAEVTIPSNGENYSFTVSGINDTDQPGDPTSVNGMGAGKPAAPGTPTFTKTDRAASNQRAVVIHWGSVAANGPTPVQYQVTRAGAGQPICSWTTATSCSDDLPLNGSVYSYVVTAKNGEQDSERGAAPGEHTSAPSAAGTMESAMTPDSMRLNSLVATGANQELRVAFASGASHGKTNRVECQVNGSSCGSWTYALGGASDTKTLNVPVSNGSVATLRLRACNGSSGGAQTGSECSAWVQSTATPYGPIGNASISASASGDHVNWSASWDANGKPVNVVIKRGGTTLWSSNSTGSGSKSGSDAIGYSKTGNYVVTVSDPGRATQSSSKSVTTPAPPAPVPAVTVTKGAQKTISGCTVAACRWVVVTTKNFPGSVSCHISSAYPNTVGFVSWTQGGNETKQTLNVYGYPGKSITATCNGVSGSTTW